MYITPVNNNYNYKRNFSFNPSFTSIGTILTQYNDYKGISRSAQVNTCLRNDLNYNLFGKMVKYLIAPQKSKNILQRLKQSLKLVPEQPWKKINIYSLAGADGTEAYALADGIIGAMGFENASKYVFPIHVSDVNEWVINDYGKKGIINFLEGELDKLPNIRQFLDLKNQDTSSRCMYNINIKPEFRKCFDFEVADLQAKIESLPEAKADEINIFVIRNCLVSAFSPIEREYILSNLTYKYPDSNTFVVLGGYDLEKMRESKFGAFYPSRVGLKSVGNNTFVSCVNKMKQLDQFLHNQ